MIVSLIVHALLSPITFLLGLLPSLDTSALTGAESSLSDSRIWQWFGWANYFLPLDFVLLVIGLRVAIGLAMFGFEFLSWAGTKLHIFGGAQ